jgi:hypothetical protein
MSDDITPEWLQEIGFDVSWRPSPLCRLWKDDHLLVTASFRDRVTWGVNGCWMPEFAFPKTRADVLRLCAAMGHQVPKGGETNG